jgi:hypothetical protein
MKQSFLAVAGATALAASLIATPSASAADAGTSDVSAEKWQEIWAEIGYPDTADSWACYLTPQEFNRDPDWVIVSFQTRPTPECEGLPSDPYPELVTQVDGQWTSVTTLGPMPCADAVEAAWSDGAPQAVGKDLMKEGWCEPSPMWRGYMERYLNTKVCKAPLTPRVNEYRVGRFGRGDQVTDGAVAWTCTRAVGGAQDQYLTVFLAGPQPRQITRSLKMQQFESITIRRNRIIVTGGTYSGTAPLCCPDLRVKETFQMKDGKLVRLKTKVTPV